MARYTEMHCKDRRFLLISSVFWWKSTWSHEMSMEATGHEWVAQPYVRGGNSSQWGVRRIETSEQEVLPTPVKVPPDVLSEINLTPLPEMVWGHTWIFLYRARTASVIPSPTCGGAIGSNTHTPLSVVSLCRGKDPCIFRAISCVPRCMQWCLKRSMEVFLVSMTLSVARSCAMDKLILWLALLGVRKVYWWW